MKKYPLDHAMIHVTFDHWRGTSADDTTVWTQMVPELSPYLLALSGQNNPSYLFTVPDYPPEEGSPTYVFSPVYAVPEGCTSPPVQKPTSTQKSLSLNPYDDRAYAVGIQSDGRAVVVGASAFQPDGQSYDTRFLAMRFNPDVSLDNCFNGVGSVQKEITGFSDKAGAVSFQTIQEPLSTRASEKILISGIAVPNTGTTNAVNLLRLNANGSIDTGNAYFGSAGVVQTPWGTGGVHVVKQGLGVQADGKIIAATTYTTALAPVQYHCGVVIYLPDGAVDTTFTTQPDNGYNQCVALAVEKDAEGNTVLDGKIALVGHTYVGGQYPAQMALWIYDSKGLPVGGETTIAFPGYNAFANSVEYRAGVITIGGEAQNTTTFQRQFAIAQVSQTGAVTTHLSALSSGNSGINGLALSFNGAFFAVGYGLLPGIDGYGFSRIASAFGIGQYDAAANGALFTRTFPSAPLGDSNANAVAVSSEGQLWVVGYEQPNYGDSTSSQQYFTKVGVVTYASPSLGLAPLPLPDLTSPGAADPFPSPPPNWESAEYPAPIMVGGATAVSVCTCGVESKTQTPENGCVASGGSACCVLRGADQHRLSDFDTRYGPSCLQSCLEWTQQPGNSTKCPSGIRAK